MTRFFWPCCSVLLAGARRGGAAAKTTKSTADLKNLFSEEAAQCRRLAEISTEQVIKEKLLEMAARFQALADEGDDDEQ